MTCAQKHSSNPFALVDAARVSGQWFEFEQMERYLTKLLRLPTRKQENRLQAGMTYRMNYRPTQALAQLERVASAPQKAFLANLEMAVIHERQGALPEAAERAHLALAEVPGNPEAALVLARTQVRDGQMDTAAALLGDTLKREPDMHYDTRAASLSLLARIREKQGDYQQAYALMGESKETLRPVAEKLPASAMSKEGEIAGFFDNLTQSHIDQLCGWNPPDGRHRVCLVTGFPRSGTTLLESMLGSHPEVEAADELPVFTNRLLPAIVQQCGTDTTGVPDRLDSFGEQQLLDLRATYLRAHSQTIGASLDGKMLVDKNPSLTVFIPFFLRVFPEIKLLVPLRDPRDVLLSCYSQYLPINPWSIHFLDLEKAARRFANVMGYWVKMRVMLPAASWREVKYEELVSAPESELRRIFDSLELPYRAEALAYHTSASVTVHNAPTYADVKEVPHRRAVGRWENYAERFAPLRPVLEPIMNKLGYSW